ncbi:hypothetical protein X798_02602 [Onchocerca flexuosa]|uniref:Uncharacterized protein n=1 Tax=Onchocerca flexuosa TaxID=387005 RepID=A0A238BZP4_9BILA|nr:hypothetical protein X798_02602 [Onchocerca flexuosa]
MMQEQIGDKNSKVNQRLNWERLKKRIHRQMNKTNIGNLLNAIRDLLREKVIRESITISSLKDVMNERIKLLLSQCPNLLLIFQELILRHGKSAAENSRSNNAIFLRQNIPM